MWRKGRGREIRHLIARTNNPARSRTRPHPALFRNSCARNGAAQGFHIRKIRILGPDVPRTQKTRILGAAEASGNSDGRSAQAQAFGREIRFEDDHDSSGQFQKDSKRRGWCCITPKPARFKATSRGISPNWSASSAQEHTAITMYSKEARKLTRPRRSRQTVRLYIFASWQDSTDARLLDASAFISPLNRRFHLDFLFGPNRTSTVHTCVLRSSGPHLHSSLSD